MTKRLPTNIPPFYPHMVRAAHAWISEYGTPQLMVLGVTVTDPVMQQYVSKPKRPEEAPVLVLNISTTATGNLTFGAEGISFQCRFGGKPHDCFVQYEQIVSIYDRETGAGVPICPVEAILEWWATQGQSIETPVKSDRPKLKIVH